MPISRTVSFVLTLIATSLLSSSALASSSEPPKKRRYYSTETRPYTPKTYQDHGLADQLTPKGRSARGFYITPYYLRKVGPKRTARTMRRARMNAVVIDIKDDWGEVLWPSEVALSKGLQRHLIRDPKATIEAFHKEGIYVIARLVCFKDSRLPHLRPDLSVRFQRSGKRLFRAGAGWIDAYSREVQDYLVDLALEWEGFGVDEIQLDYIRFPKGRAGAAGLWLHQRDDKRPRSELIAAFLDRIDRALKVPLSADVYGLTTLVDGDPRTLGQTIETMSRYVEAISPMMYANGMTTYFKGNTITEGVYGLIQCGLWRARHKTPKGVVLRPYLQSYPNQVPFFGEDFIRRQVLAARKAGSDGFLFWNSTMKNGVAYRALSLMSRAQVSALGDAEKVRQAARRPAAWCNGAGEGNVFDPVAAGAKKKPKAKRTAIQ